MDLDLDIVLEGFKIDPVPWDPFRALRLFCKVLAWILDI